MVSELMFCWLLLIAVMSTRTSTSCTVSQYLVGGGGERDHRASRACVPQARNHAHKNTPTKTVIKMSHFQTSKTKNKKADEGFVPNSASHVV